MVDAKVEIRVLPELAMAVIAPRRGAEMQSRAEHALGIALPECGRTRLVANLRAVCVRPNEWLMLQDGPADSLRALLAEALGDTASMIDMSGAYVGVRVGGAGARAALGKFLPLDLHPRAMQPGHAAATLAAHLPVLFWQSDDMPTYDLLCTRSRASSFRHALELITVP